ncbi:MAG: TetM/TetW/TetO/TetS family tetracycline resistance ribosomal protection protein, partial [Bacillota bacterium]|nr:TetM/TetW/TetO/TetS family tetracycline resistance ribosomal protection protein [Bacillota bacterium]
MQKKTIGILAHVDAGKTTFSEQLLYHTKSIRQRGRVDHKDTFLDSHDIEKERGITVFADQAMFSYNDSLYHLIDTPGHVDFSPEMERSIQVMDYAIILLSAVEGIQGHTETVWQTLKKYRIPTFFYINKTDRVGADVPGVLSEISAHFTGDAYDITDSFGHDELSEELVEWLAERDEVLLDRFMDDNYDVDFWLNTMISLLKERRIFLVMTGSALQDQGVIEFLEKMDRLTITDYSRDESFAARVYKIRYDENGTRQTFMKALKGSLKVRDEITYGKEETREKVTQIRLYNGNKYKTTDEVNAGDLFAVVGLTQAEAGDGLGSLKDNAAYEVVPALKSKVIFDQSIHPKDVLKHFHILDAEDPSLNVTWEEHLQQITIQVMGTIQLEVLQRIIKERFLLSVSFADPEILYKETIESSVTGCGHFEPLGHYAEVHVKLEPGLPNSGISFENACHADDLPIGYQNLVRQHLFERDHHGILTGSPLTDIKVTLLTGRAHNKHTSGGDFREATLRALRQGLEKAVNVLLEPFYDVKIKVELHQLGRVLADLQTACGTFDPPQTTGDTAVVTGRVPVATFKNYSTTLASFTQGKGSITLVFGGYDRCYNEEEIIHNRNYNKDADPEYTSSSIFCAKGHGYTVTWDEA